MSSGLISDYREKSYGTLSNAWFALAQGLALRIQRRVIGTTVLLKVTVTSDPPPRSYCHAVSRGFCEPRSAVPAYIRTRDESGDATRHMLAIFVKDTDSELAAFVGRRDQPHFCSFHGYSTILIPKMYRIC